MAESAKMLKKMGVKNRIPDLEKKKFLKLATSGRDILTWKLEIFDPISKFWTLLERAEISTKNQKWQKQQMLILKNISKP